MGIPVQQFPLLSFEQANPIYSSMNAGAELAHKLMMNQQQRITNQQQVVANKYFEPTLQEQLKQLQLNNKILTPQAENAPQISEAALREAIANTLYKQAVTKDLESMLPSKLKAAELKNKYPLMGEPGIAGQFGDFQYAKENMPGFNNQFTVTPDQYGQLAQGVQGAGGNVQLNQQPTVGDAVVQAQPGEQMGTGIVDPRKIALALAALKQTSAQQQSGMPFKQQLSPMPQGLQQGQQPQVAGQQPQLTGKQPQSMADIFKQSILGSVAEKEAKTNYMNIMPKIRALSNPSMLAAAAGNKDTARVMLNSFKQLAGDTSQSSDEEVSNFYNWAGDVTEKKALPAEIIKQKQYAKNLDVLLEQGESMIPSVSKYAGISGKMKLAFDKAAAQRGTVSPDYSNYLNFTRVTVPYTAGEMGRILGKQATDKMTKILTKTSDPTYWDSNPELALRQWNWMVNSFKDINKGLATPRSEINKKLSGQSTNKPTREAFLNAARQIKSNDDYSDEAIMDIYDNKYGGNE
jgi:hypothetical protein